MKSAVWRGLPSARHHGCPEPWNSRRPGPPSGPHSRGCPARCCEAPPGYRLPTSSGARPPEPTGCRRGLLWHDPRFPPDARRHRPCDNAAHAASRLSARAPRRSSRRPSDGRSSAPACPPCGLAWPTCPCRSALFRPVRRTARHRHSSPHRRRSRWRLSCRPCGSSARPPSRCGSRRRSCLGSRC